LARRNGDAGELRARLAGGADCGGDGGRVLVAPELEDAEEGSPRVPPQRLPVKLKAVAIDMVHSRRPLVRFLELPRLLDEPDLPRLGVVVPVR
jgi:hypothetical protein